MRTSFSLVVAALLPLACGPGKPPAVPDEPASAPPPATSAAPPTVTIDEAGSSRAVDDGKKAFDAGDLTGAEAAFQSAASKNPNNAAAQYGLGMVYEKAGRAPNAIEAYKAAISARSDFDDAAVRLAALYLDATPPRADDAILVCRSMLAKKPQNAALHNTLAIAMATRGMDHEGALKEFEEAIRIDGTRPMFHLSYAHWLTAWEQKGAIPHLEAARQLAKDDVAMLASIGHELRLVGEFATCVEIESKLIAKKDSAELRTERALCKLGLKDAAGVIADLQDAVKKEPGYAPAHYYLGGRFAVKKQWKEAVAEYEKYLQLDPHGSLEKLATERLAAAKQMLEKKK